jgi:hypothetical protein
MEARRARSVALWTLDPVPLDKAATIATADASAKIRLLKQQTAHPPMPRPTPGRTSVFGEVLAEIW